MHCLTIAPTVAKMEDAKRSNNDAAALHTMAFYKDFILRSGGKLPSEKEEGAKEMEEQKNDTFVDKHGYKNKSQEQIMAIVQYKMMNPGVKDFTFSKPDGSKQMVPCYG
jgi:hypothetical protein